VLKRLASRAVGVNPSPGEVLILKEEHVKDQPHAVEVPVIASVPIECLFWTEDDGWKGACAELSVTVRGSNFEEAKKNMEAALQTCIEAVLRDRKMAA